MTVVTNDRQRRAGGPAGSFASGAGGAILVGMTATLTSPTFVGRTEELARLAAAGERAAGDVPTSVLIGGEAGVGKTRLVGEVVAAARAAGVTVLHGGCVELGGEGVPFAPLVEALRAFVRDLDEPALARMVPGRSRVELARLLPELGPPAGPGAGDRAAFGGDPGPWSEQGRLFELLLGLLERLGSERPALLVVEDLHWADRSTRDLLAFLVRNLRHGRLLLVMTYRSDELHRRHPLRPFLAELDRGRRVERLELARFGPAEVAAQLAGIRGAPPPAELAERIHARSGGNAFFVEELAATAATDGELSPSLRDTLLARIELLGEPTQQVLRVLAVAAAAVPDPLLAEVAGLGEAELLAGLREAVSAHVLLVDAGDGAYGFRHALVKEAVYAELLPGERTRLHARFAAALAGRDGGGEPGLAAELAWHWYAAHDLERALPAAVEAGVAAERAYAFAEAQRQFERALELWERAGPPRQQPGGALDKTELLARAGEAAANAGAADRAVALHRAALAEVDPAADPLLAAQLTERLAFHLRVAGRPGAFEAYQEAVRLVPPEPSAARARVLAGLGQALMLRARFAEAAEVCEEAIAVAREVGAPVVEAHAMNSLGTAIARLGETDRGLAYLEEARRRGAELGAAKDEARACVNLSDLLDDLGRLEESVAVATEGIEVATAAGLRRTFGAFLAGNAAASLYHLGRWDETVELTDDFLELGDDENLNTVTLRQSRAVLDAGRGDFEAALAHVRAARRLSGDMFIAVQYPPVLAAAEAEVAAWQGRLEDASAAVAGGWPPCRARSRTCGPTCCSPSGCGSRVTGPGWPPPATTTTPWPTPGWSPASCCAGPGPPWTSRRWPRGGPCWPPARPSSPGPGRARPGGLAGRGGRLGGGRPPLPAGHGPLAGGRGAAGQAGRPRPGRRPAPPGPRRGHGPGRRAAPPRAGAAGQAGPGGAGPGPSRRRRRHAGRRHAARGGGRRVARPDRPRARGAGPGGRGPQQPPGRRRPVHQRQDGQRARVQHPGQAGRGQPGRGGGGRPPPRPARRAAGAVTPRPPSSAYWAAPSTRVGAGR